MKNVFKGAMLASSVLLEHAVMSSPVVTSIAPRAKDFFVFNIGVFLLQ